MHTLTTTSIETWLRWMLNSDLEPSIFTTPKGLNIYVLTIRKNGN